MQMKVHVIQKFFRGIEEETLVFADTAKAQEQYEKWLKECEIEEPPGDEVAGYGVFWYMELEVIQ